MGDYAFTTLTPNLGVADIDEDSLLIADIPGLIEGAAEGKGLGDAFLRHVERTAVLLHLVDAYSNDVATDYRTIMHELAAYSPDLPARPQVVALTKIEGLDKELVQMQFTALQKVILPETPLFAISASAHQGLGEVLRTLRDLVAASRVVQPAAEPEQDMPIVIELSKAAQQKAWHVQRDGEHRYLVTGSKIEHFAARTNFDAPAGVQRLRDIMGKMGIMHHLLREGLEIGDEIVIGNSGQRFTYN